MHTGLRFNGGADTTIKLRSGCRYRLQISSTPAVAFVGPLLMRTRRAEFHEPTLLEACCCLPVLGAAPPKYTNMACAVRGNSLLHGVLGRFKPLPPLLHASQWSCGESCTGWACCQRGGPLCRHCLCFIRSGTTPWPWTSQKRRTTQTVRAQPAPGAAAAMAKLWPSRSGSAPWTSLDGASVASWRCRLTSRWALGQLPAPLQRKCAGAEA